MAFEVKLKGNSEGIFSRQIVQKGLSNIYIYVDRCNYDVTINLRCVFDVVDMRPYDDVRCKQ